MRQEEAGHQPPSAFVERRNAARPYSGFGGSSASQGNWRTNWIGLQCTEASILRPMISKAKKPKMQRQHAEIAEIDRTDLRVADHAEPVWNEGALLALDPSSPATPGSGFRGRTWTWVKMFS